MMRQEYISPEHKEKFEELITRKAPFMKKLDVHFRIEYSIQKSSTCRNAPSI